MFQRYVVRPLRRLPWFRKRNFSPEKSRGTETVLETDTVLVSIDKAETGSSTGGGSVLLSFTGIGHAMGGIDVQRPEFYGTGRAFDRVIFITDKTRSWGNRLDFGQIAEVVSELAGSARLVTIGNSMGGFLAIIATRYMPVTTSVAFAPQYSVNPRFAPWEKRWGEYLNDLSPHTITHAADYITDRTTYFVFSGGEGVDRQHAMGFPVRPNLHHYLFPDVGHGVAGTLKGRGELSGLLHACFSGTPDIRTSLAFERLSPGPATPER
jgi:hypothetical protein